MLEAILLTIMTAATPLLLAALGELVVERSGVLNLGVEGMMIMGAVAGFAVAQATGSAGLGAVGGVLAGMAMAALFAVLVLALIANQVATGLALTLLGLGLSGMIGEAFVGVPGVRLRDAPIPLLSEAPFLGPLLFSQDPIFYVSIALTVGVSWFLFHARAGLTLRAVGDNHVSAHSLGVPVIGVRLAAILFGGACAGLAGAYLSLVYTPQWVENMTAGRGWIALALVVFASWLPWRALIGAYLFGGITVLTFHAQAVSPRALETWPAFVAAPLGFVFGLPAQFLSMLPYLATIAVLVIISTNRRLTLLNTPACLGKPFVPDR